MLRSVTLWITFALVASTCAQATLPDALQDDAGSGGDAPDDPEHAYRLDGPGDYRGTLAPPGDSDWYSLALPSGETSCVRFEAEGAGYGLATLALGQGLALNVSQPFSPIAHADLGIVSPSIPTAYLGFTPLETGPLSPHSPLAFGSVDFRASILTPASLPPGDAGSGLDAGNLTEGSLPVPAPCFGGTLDEDDVLDVFTFRADEGDELLLSFGVASSTTTVLTLVSPGGEEVARLTSGDAVTQAVNETGEWSLAVRHYSPLQSSYLVGMSMDFHGPEPDPCRPTCMLA